MTNGSNAHIKLYNDFKELQFLLGQKRGFMFCEEQLKDFEFGLEHMCIIKSQASC